LVVGGCVSFRVPRAVQRVQRQEHCRSGSSGDCVGKGYQPAGAWRREAEFLGLFNKTFAGGTDRGKDTHMGMILKGAVSRRVRLLDDEGNVKAVYELVSQQVRENMEYAFIPIQK
jgi:hypothetical protein